MTPKTTRLRRVALVAAAAAALGACAGKKSLGDLRRNVLGDDAHEDQRTSPPPSDVDVSQRLSLDGFNLSLNAYESCDALQQEVRAQLLMRADNERAMREWQAAQAAAAAKAGNAPGAAGGGGSVDNAAAPSASGDTAQSDADGSTDGGDAESFTNVQEKGVDEADFVKLGAHHLYVARSSRVEVIDRASLQEIGALDLQGLSSVRLYAEGDRLVVIGQASAEKKPCHKVEQYHYQPYYYPASANALSSPVGGGDVAVGVPAQPQEPTVEIVEQCFSYVEASTVVRVYAAQPGSAPTLADEKRFEEPYADSRFLAGHVVLLFNSSLPFARPESVEAVCGLDQWCYQSYYQTLNNAARGNSYYGWYYPQFDPFFSRPRKPGEAADALPEIPAAPVAVGADGTVAGVACDRISKPYIADLDFRLTKVVSVDTRDTTAKPFSSAILGGGDQLYMTTSGLYLAKQGLRWQPWQPPEPVSSDPAAQQATWEKRQALMETLVVTKLVVDAASGDLGPRAVGAVQGRVKDQWAFKEYADKGVLAVATTTWRKVKPETTTDGQHNHLWILQEEGKTLALKAAINDFGAHEDIRAARYLGTMAYIVTFEKTDPLFAFDLSDPLQPKLLSELEIPGFSMYLHPLDDGRLLGVGYDADDQGDFSWFQGVQVSLFDTTDPTKMARLDAKVIGDRGSYSDVNGDHKAFFQDKEHGLVGIPVVEKVKQSGTVGGPEQAQKLVFAGAIVYAYRSDKLEEVARLSHQDLIGAECAQQGNDWHWWQDARRSLDINRLYSVDGRLLTVSRFGVKAHDPANPAVVTATVKFEGGAADCSTRGE